MRIPLSNLAFAGLLLTLPWTAGCASAPSQPAGHPSSAEDEAPPGTTETEEASEDRGGESTPSAWESPEPPDGNWLVDEDGRRYFLMPIPKRIPHEVKEDGDVHVLLAGEFEIDSEDDENFYTRYYDSDVEPVVYSPPPTEEELEATAESYRFDTPDVDRVDLVPLPDGLPGSGQWRNGFELADLNGDGVLDLVHGPPRKRGSLPVVFLGDGEGGWRLWEDLSFPPGELSYGDVAVADFNGDQLPDLAAASHGIGVKVFVQVEPGRFEKWSRGTDLSFRGPSDQEHRFSSRRIAAVDWNQDGRMDVVALDDGPRLSLKGGQPKGTSIIVFGPVVFINEGHGLWSPVFLEEPSDQQQFGNDLSVEDFDGDGRPDFVIATSRGWRRDLLHLNSLDETWEVAEIPQIRPHAYVRALATGDFDEDGTPDVALAYMAYEHGWRSGLDLFLNKADGWTRRAVFAREGRAGFTAVDAGDLDGDGNLDLVALDTTGNGMVFLGRGDGRFVRDQSSELDRPRGRCRAYEVKVTDLDGNGGGEIVASYAGEPSALWDPERCRSQGGLMAWSVRGLGSVE